jgi:hypothetical protein
MSGGQVVLGGGIAALAWLADRMMLLVEREREARRRHELALKRKPRQPRQRQQEGPRL